MDIFKLLNLIGTYNPIPAFRDGGLIKAKSGIHIKPENEGKLTNLKKRTGKTEAEL